jgi:Mrp family chromosome partitioning ATPase
METRKRLGKGLEDISHLFISKQPPAELAGRTVYRPAEKMTQGSPRRFSLVSATRGYPVAFWAMNLAAALSRGGKRCLLIEGHTGSESLSEMLNLPSVHPSLGEFLNHKDKQLTHGDRRIPRHQGGGARYPVRDPQARGGSVGFCGDHVRH